MKKFFVFSVLLCMVTTASAQFANVGNSNNSPQKKDRSSKQIDIPDSYKSFYLQYNAQKIDKTLSGFALGGNWANKIADNEPFYIEYGIAAQYTTKDDLKMASLKLPIDITYRIFLPSSNDVYFAPILGIDFKGHVWGENNGTDIFSDDFWPECKRFQIGWHVGLNIGFSGCYVGIKYGTDFMEFIKGADEIKTTSITLGFNL